MVQWVEVYSAKPDDWSSAPGIHIRRETVSASAYVLWHAQVHTHTQKGGESGREREGEGERGRKGERESK